MTECASTQPISLVIQEVAYNERKAVQGNGGSASAALPLMVVKTARRAISASPRGLQRPMRPWSRAGQRTFTCRGWRDNPEPEGDVSNEVGVCGTGGLRRHGKDQTARHACRHEADIGQGRFSHQARLLADSLDILSLVNVEARSHRRGS